MEDQKRQVGRGDLIMVVELTSESRSTYGLTQAFRRSVEPTVATRVVPPIANCPAAGTLLPRDNNAGMPTRLTAHVVTDTLSIFSYAPFMVEARQGLDIQAWVRLNYVKAFDGTKYIATILTGIMLLWTPSARLLLCTRVLSTTLNIRRIDLLKLLPKGTA